LTREVKDNLPVTLWLRLEGLPETVLQFGGEEVVELAGLRVLEETDHLKLVAELRKRQRADSAMMVLADRPDVGNLRGAVLRKRLNVVILHLVLRLDGMVIDEAVERPLPPLLGDYLQFLGVG
jgi:hypothetical protein